MRVVPTSFVLAIYCHSDHSIKYPSVILFTSFEKSTPSPISRRDTPETSTSTKGFVLENDTLIGKNSCSSPSPPVDSNSKLPEGLDSLIVPIFQSKQSPDTS